MNREIPANRCYVVTYSRNVLGPPRLGSTALSTNPCQNVCLVLNAEKRKRINHGGYVPFTISDVFYNPLNFGKSRS